MYREVVLLSLRLQDFCQQQMGIAFSCTHCLGIQIH